MRLIDIYDLAPIRTSYNEGERLISCFKESQDASSAEAHLLSHIEHSDNYQIISEIEKEKRLEIRYYMSEGDDKYGAMLFSIFFDHTPIMVVHNDGKYYSEYRTFVSDKSFFIQAQDYILSKLETTEKNIHVYDENEDIANLEVVNHYNLFDYYSPNVEPTYKTGDVVWGWVPENHLMLPITKDYKGFILTQVVINRVNPLHPHDTYRGTQTQRKWDGTRGIIFVEKGRFIGCSLNDKKIVGLVNEIPMPRKAINNFVNELGEINADYIGPDEKDFF